MSRVRLLARQSLTRSDSVSVAAQIATMTAAFVGMGHTIIDPPLTAQNTRGWREIADRTDLTEALASADRREYDALGVYSIDRLCRSVRILETVVHELERHGVGLLSYSEPFVSDPFMRQIMGAVAERFSSDLSRRMASIWPMRHAAGKHHGIPPYGFVAVDGTLVQTEETPILRRMTDTILAGGTVREIVTALNAEGVAPRRADAWSECIVRVILRNPALAGGVRLNGAVVWDAHDGVISRVEWKRIQARLGQAHQPRAHKLATSWLDGLVEHACGARAYVLLYRPRHTEVRMIACRTSHLPAADRCTILPRGASARKVEAAVRQALARDLTTAAPIDRAMAHAERLAGSDLTAKRRAKLASDRARVVERRQRAEGLYLDGRRDAEWWAAEEAEAVAALTAIDDQLTALPQPPAADRYAAIGERIAEVAPHVETLPDAALRAILTDAGVVILDGVEVTIRYTPSWARFVENPSRVRWR